MNGRTPEEARIASREWREKNRERHRAYSKAWAAAHPGISQARALKWAKDNRAQHLANARAWRKKNPGVNRAATVRYREKLRRAVPKWANAFFVMEAYRLASLRSRATGLPWDVDHIVPLRSKVVCGLHCEANLQVILARVNRSKQNSTWPDMPEVANA